MSFVVCICYALLLVISIILIPLGTFQMMAPNIEQSVDYVTDTGMVYFNNNRSTCIITLESSNHSLNTICYSYTFPSNCTKKCTGSLIAAIISYILGTICFISACFGLLFFRQIESIKQVSSISLPITDVITIDENDHIAIGRSSSQNTHIVVINP